MIPQSMDRLLASFKNRCILVIGDLMVDEYLWGNIERISPEAPVPVLKLVRRESTLGGTGNVIKNLASLGASVIALGVTGLDAAGNSIVEELESLQVDCGGVWKDPHRGSTRKARLMSVEHGQQVFRFDEECSDWIDSSVEDRLLAILDSRIEEADAILCSDYLKGVLTPRILGTVFAKARSFGKRTIVAPKDSNLEKYRGAHTLVPNAKELAQLAGVRSVGPQALSEAAAGVIRQIEAEAILVTRGSEGMSLFEANGVEVRRTDIPTFARSVYDVTGAGDTVVSVFTLGIASGGDNRTSACLANVAAGIVVGKRGTASLTTNEISHLLNEPRTAPVLGSAMQLD